MNCEAVLELVALEDGEDNAAVSAHLAVCPQCRARLSSSEALGRHLRHPLLWEDPPEHLREAVVAAISGEAVRKERRPRWWMLGVAAALMVVVVLTTNVIGRPDWTLELQPGPAAPEAAGTITGWNMDYGTRMVVDVSGLAPTGTDAYYEMWLTAPDGRHVSAGTFRMSGRFEVMAGVRRADYPRIWITQEPADDDPSPFPATVLDMPEA